MKLEKASGLQYSVPADGELWAIVGLFVAVQSRDTAAQPRAPHQLLARTWMKQTLKQSTSGLLDLNMSTKPLSLR